MPTMVINLFKSKTVQIIFHLLYDKSQFKAMRRFAVHRTLIEKNVFFMISSSTLNTLVPIKATKNMRRLGGKRELC